MPPRGAKKDKEGSPAVGTLKPEAEEEAAPPAKVAKRASGKRGGSATAAVAAEPECKDAAEPDTKRSRRGAAAAAAAAAVSVSKGVPDAAETGKGKGKGNGKGTKEAKQPLATVATGKGQDQGEAAATGGGGGGTEDGGSSGLSYYLMKSEPEEFSLDELEGRPDQTGHWEGVRNAQARNIMKGMKLGDTAFFYHSSCKVPACMGVVRVVREAYPDHFAFDKASKYFDASSTPDKPKWWMVDVQLVRRLARPVTLAELRAEGARSGSPVADMVLINKSRLSVQPVTAAQWQRILELEKQPQA